MALTAYLRLKGQKQGDIEGSVTQRGREKAIAVHSFTHEIASPRDIATGQATGKRQHKGFTLVKDIDKSSPLLWEALDNNENIVSWELQLWQPTLRAVAGIGMETQYYTIRLTDAAVTSMREFMLDDLDPSSMKFPVREEVTFTYRRVEWTWTDGGISSISDV